MRLFVVCYDISDDDLREWVAGELKEFGFRVQKSVFECHLDRGDLVSLSRRFEGRLEPGDDVRFYPLCVTCRDGAVSTAGKAPRRLPAFQVI